MHRPIEIAKLSGFQKHYATISTYKVYQVLALGNAYVGNACSD